MKKEDIALTLQILVFAFIVGIGVKGQYLPLIFQVYTVPIIFWVKLDSDSYYRTALVRVAGWVFYLCGLAAVVDMIQSSMSGGFNSPPYWFSLPTNAN